MGTHLGLTKTTNNNRQTIRPTSTSQGVQLLVYQPLGTTNNERVYVYNGDQKSPLPGKRGLAKTTRVASSVTTTNAKHATLTLTTTKYTYQNQLAKVLLPSPAPSSRPPSKSPTSRCPSPGWSCRANKRPG